MDSEATAAEYQNGQDFVMTFEENITLYAVWEAVDCVIYFNANAEDSEGIINNGTCKYDQYYTIPDTKYIRVGYTMLGWATSAQATTPEYNSGDIIEPSLDGVTLYAVWATSQVPYDVNSMANIYTNYDLNYDYTIIKGLNYTFDGVTLEAILNASTDEVAEISGNELVANNTGTFTLRLYRTSNPYDVWEFTVLVVESNYTIIYTEENMTITEQNPNKEIILNENADWAGGKNLDMFAYEFGVNKELDFISRIGYTFHGWTLVEDAFIGGKWIKAGTKLTTFDNMNPNTIIPCGSIGNIKLRASVKIDQYELSFHAYDFTNSEYVLISAINGYYNAHWTASLNYSEDRLINDLIAAAPNGYMFAGWYSSTTQFNEDTRFDGYFNNHYSNLYARYIELPAIDPDSISVTTSNIITWDKIEDISDADDVTYIVTVKMLDGAVEKVVSTIETQENKIDAALLITLENTDYIIEVAAKITFADDRSKFTNSATTEISTLNYTTSEIEVMSYSSMLEVFEGETSETLAISKRIVFTGMTYTFNFTDQNKVITIEDVSEEGLVQIGELNDNGEFVEVLDGNYTLRGGKYSVVMIIAKDKVGTFVMRQGSATRNVEVVPNIIGTSHGSSYANHLAIASNYKTEGFLDENHESVSEEYQVGALNEFQFDLKLDGDKYNLFKFNDAESKYSRAIIYLLDEQGNIVVDELGTPYDLFCDNETEYANALHYNPSTKEFTTTIDGTTIPCGVTRTENGFKFNEELGSYGIRYRVNLYVAFTRTNTGLEDTNSNKVREVNYIDGVLDVSKLSAPVVYDITLNNGVNVYNSAQLKAAYGDVSKEIEVMIINIHRDIVATLDEEQMQDDGSPINVLSQYVYDNDTNYTNSSDSNIRKTDGNIFKRASSKVNDKVVVNGNYCTIDATDVVLIPTDNYTDSVEADGNGTNHQVGFQKSTSGSGKYVRGQTGIFRYQCPNNGTAVFNNLNIVGNRPDNNLSDADKMDPEKVIDFERLQSGSLIGIYNENSRVIINNSKISKTYYAVKNDSAFGVGQNAYMELNYTKISDTYSDGYYGWNGKELRVFNSYMTDLGGMPFHMQDASAINPIFIIDENTVVDNLLSGTEGWFVTWGKAGLAASLKSTLQTALQTWGASVLTGDSGNFVNPIFVYNPTDMVNGDGNETKYGAYVTTGGSKIMCPANLIKKDESTNKYYYELNGEKLIAGYVYDENNNILNGYYIKNSVTSFKNIEYIAANPDADARVQQGMYVFTRNDAVSAQEFNALQAQLMTLFSTLTTAPADITNVPIVKYAAGIKAYEAACKLYQTYGLTPVSRDVFEAISLYIYNCIQASSTPSVEGACQLLLANNLIVAADQEMQTKVGVLLLNAETTLATIDEQFVKSGFANIKLVEAALASLNTSVTNTPIKTIMLNAIKEYCTANNVTANDSLLESTINNLIAIDPEELEEYLSDGSDLEQCIAQLILEETAMSTLNSELSNYYTNTFRAVGGLKVTDYASIATEVVAVEFVRNNPEATISDRNANNLVNLTLYLAQTEHEGTTLLNQLVAKYGDVNTGTYILYSLGHEINEEDMIIELVIPSNNGTTSYMSPMLLLCTTGMSYPDSKWYSQS
ncbi:MAG: InlB B-repeat-containing protein [Clostridia bacterium]|nr:InlB B-repeat-containing protein [Clostridia bacterium]